MRRWRTFVLLLWGLSVSIAAAQESPFLYGIHDHDTGQQVFLDRLKANGATGWVTATIAIGSNPNDTGGGDFHSISSQGHGVIVRLNNGYCGEGTIPAPSRYDDFAGRVASYVAATSGASLFVIGNETNLPAEWPIVNGRKVYVSPADYATLFRKTYDRIKAVRPDAKVLVQALAPFAGPYGAGSVCGYAHDANPLNWVQYTRQMLDAIRATGGIDGIALHINSRGYFYNDIHSTQRVNAGGQSLSFSFYVYKDWVDLGIPPSLYHLPVYATEANGIYYWKGGHPERPDSHYERGWVQEVYAEIHRYNQQAAATGKPIFRAVNLYRWCSHCDGWNIDGSPYENPILDDVGAAAQAQYRWPSGGATPPPPLPAGENLARRTVAWSASSTFNASFGGDRAYDGVVSGASKWTSDGLSALSWLALDLGATYDVTGFVVRHAGAGGEATQYNTEAFRLETGSSLAGPWVTESTVANSSRANVSTVVLPQSKLARYVRLTITDAGIDNYARIPELEVYGHPLSTPPSPPPPPMVPPPGTNAARASVAWQASSTFNAASSGNKAYDGVVSEGSKWTSNGQSATSWLALDLGAKHVVTGVIVRHAGAGGEPAYFNTQAFRLERADSFAGPWTSLATVDNATQQASSIVHLTTPLETRFVRLFVTDAGIDNYARIPELEVYSTGTVPTISSLVTNGDFSAGLNGWSTWTERAPMSVAVESGQLVEQGGNYNGGVYQQFATGGAGRKIDVSAFWASGPTAANRQWGEILVINGSRLPVNGQDVSAANADVVLLYKNDTWMAPGGWSGPVSGASFTSAGPTATIVLKSGNTAGTTTGARFDDVLVEATKTAPPPGNGPPDAVLSATPAMGPAPLDVSFDGSGSSDPDNDPLTYSWTFGDGGQATGVTASHRYTSAGTFTAKLTVQDGRGGTDDATASIAVGTSQPPVLPPGCPPALHFDPIRAQLALQGKELVHSKIGFHVGPGGNQTGLGIFLQCLDAAGVPFFLKSADSAGQIYEAAQLKAASGVPHVLVYRRSGSSFDVPDYGKAPYDAAVEHWQKHRSLFPPELEAYKHLIWVETINEIDKNRSEWLGEFAYHSANLAMADGFNWAAFGWSSGEPEPEHWRGPKMRQFLELAAHNPTRVAVAIHEYSYVTDNLTNQFPYLVGRFQQIFDAADERGLARPTILITEFGWAYQNVPSPEQAMGVDLPWADELYSRFPEIQGAAIWYLGPGFGGISNQTQKLIAPLTEYALQSYFVIDRDP